MFEKEKTEHNRSPLAKSRQFRFRKIENEKAQFDALIEECEAYILRTIKLSDQNVWVIEQFEEKFEEEIVQIVLKRLTKSKKYEIKEISGLSNIKVKALMRKIKY